MLFGIRHALSISRCVGAARTTFIRVENDATCGFMFVVTLGTGLLFDLIPWTTPHIVFDIIIGQTPLQEGMIIGSPFSPGLSR